MEIIFIATPFWVTMLSALPWLFCNMAPTGMQASSKRHQPLCSCDTGIRVYDLAVGKEENHSGIEEPATKFRKKGVVRRRLVQHHISKEPFLVAFSS